MYVSPSNGKPYVPPLGISSLTPIYDYWLKFLGYNNQYHQQIIGFLDIKDGGKILDVGCGTGTTLVMIKTQFPKAKLTGVDPDKKAIQTAKTKSQRQNVDISFVCAYGQKLPFPSKSFDKVLSSIAFHHLTTLNEKRETLAEIHRVLKKGGTFLLVDHWPGGSNIFQEFWYWLGAMIDNQDPHQDNQHLPNLLKETGFTFAEVKVEAKNNLHYLSTRRG